MSGRFEVRDDCLVLAGSDEIHVAALPAGSVVTDEVVTVGKNQVELGAPVTVGGGAVSSAIPAAHARGVRLARRGVAGHRDR